MGSPSRSRSNGPRPGHPAAALKVAEAAVRAAERLPDDLMDPLGGSGGVSHPTRQRTRRVGESDPRRLGCTVAPTTQLALHQLLNREDAVHVVRRRER